MPRPTKNSVTKKSRRLVTLATTSSVYGKVEIITPAISAPIAVDKPSQPANPAMAKHHASAPTSTSSGRRATTLKTGGSTNRLARNATDSSRMTLPSAWTSGPTAGFFKFGWMRQKQDHRDVLQHQHAERDAARKRFQFAFVVKNFDDDDRAAHRRRDREIKRLQPVSRRADEIENQPAQHKAAENLHARP